MTFFTLKQKFDIYDASKRTSVFPNVHCIINMSQL